MFTSTLVYSAIWNQYKQTTPIFMYFHKVEPKTHLSDLFVTPKIQNLHIEALNTHQIMY